MSLPFTVDAFFGVFARYNEAVWPLVLVLWLAAAIGLIATVRRPGAAASRWMTTLLAVLWAWGGVVYHAAFFAAINPAAWVFALLFVVEAGLLAEIGLRRGGLAFGQAAGVSRIAGIALAAYALAYPGLAALTSHAYPATPTFGVPCPTGLYTIGMLLTLSRPAPIVLAVIPTMWAIVGGSAAVVLDVPVDYVLLASALFVPIRLFFPKPSSRAPDGAATRTATT